MNPSLPERARIFATAAHAAAGQTRKYTGEPYINHPAEVVAILSQVPHTEEMLAAAWLHDVVEDTGVELDDIRREFGPYVRDLVFWLTDTATEADGNREARKAKERARLAQAPAAAQTIKLADLISNTATIVDRDPGFAKVYLREKELLLPWLSAGDVSLQKRARSMVEAGRR